MSAERRTASGGGPASPALREPDLPRTAKDRRGPLRTGWTTGACAAAAAKAAALLLAGAARPETVEIPLPQPFQGSDRARFAVERAAGGEGWAEAVVVKDAGDDPDCTHGAHLTVRLEPATEPAGPEQAAGGLVFHGGDGVGTVTKPGLGLPVGEPAINGAPRRMIAAAVGEVLDLDRSALHCTISVPDGERMAIKTTNRRLGILGGISILGTTGVVRPFSTASWQASVVQAVDVLATTSEGPLVLATGGRTEKAAVRLLPDLPESCFVEVGDFTGAALRQAADHGLERALFVGMAGKLTKLAAGVVMTHYTRSKVDLALLGDLARQAGAEAALADELASANTARHAYERWRAAGLDRLGDLLCAQAAANLTRFTEAAVTVDALLVDFDSLELVGASPGWRAGRWP